MVISGFPRHDLARMSGEKDWEKRKKRKEKENLVNPI